MGEANGNPAGRRSFLAGGIAMLALGTLPARAAEGYPSRAITIVVPFPAGSVADAISRQFGQHLASALKVSVVIENKAGAGGMLGATAVARAPADGYTLLTTTNTTHSAVESLFKNVAYNPVSDFTHLARVARVLTIIVVKADSQFRTIGDLVGFAKANPGKVEYGHGNSSGQVLGETLKSANDLNIVRISYRGVPQVLTDLIGGQIKMAAVDLATALPLLQAGTIRALAVSTRARSTLLPDVPTLNETVVPGYDLTPWFGFAGPAGLPDNVTEILARELKAFADRTDAQSKLRDISVDVVWVGRDQIIPFVTDEREKWMRFVKAAGIQPE